MKRARCFLLVALAGATPCWAVMVTLFQNTDTFLERARDIVVVRVLELPKNGIIGWADGIYPAETEIVQVWKGGKKPGKHRIATIYPMAVGSLYLISSLGGSAHGTDLLAIPELSVIPLPPHADLHSLESGTLRERFLRLIEWRKEEVAQERKTLEKENQLLESAAPTP